MGAWPVTLGGLVGAIVEGFFTRQGGARRWVPARRRTHLDEAQALVMSEPECIW